MSETASEASLLAASASGDLGEVERLLASGVPAYAQEEAEGMSALMHAAAGGHGEVVSALLIAGAPWNAIDRCGRCAGNHALDNGHQQIVDALVDAAVRAELLLGAAERGTRKASEAAAESKEYLSRSIRYEGDTLFDEGDDAVMMAWETPLMEEHAKRLCATGGDVMNVGFGMGIIDGFIQGLAPRSHTIIEAHPGVLSRMRKDGWMDKPGVRVCEGRWQDALKTLVADGVRFDGIFFDTYGEYDADMADFHQALPSLLKPNGLYSFFNGMCPFNVFFQGVACSVVQLELQALGLTTQFEPVEIQTPSFNEGDAAWAGVKRQYFSADTYFLPQCIMGDGEDDDEAGGSGGGADLMEITSAADGPAGQLVALNRSAISFLARSIATGDASLQEAMREHVLCHFESVGWAILEPLTQLWATAAAATAAEMEPAAPPASFTASALPSRAAFEASLKLADDERIEAERSAAAAGAIWHAAAAAAERLDANSGALLMEVVKVANLLLVGGEAADAWRGGGENDELRLALLPNDLAGDEQEEDVAGRDSEQKVYASAEDVWSSSSSSQEGVGGETGWYGSSREYWSAVKADVDGMLGGLGIVHPADVEGSLGFIDGLRADGLLAPSGGVALDCGAGIGRVAKHVLLERFASVELLEPDGRFLEQAKRELPSGRALAYHEAGLQDFVPPSGARYTVVWMQWVLIYLTDEHLVRFLARCAKALASTSGALLVVKESVSREGKGFYVDKSDGSITRTAAHFGQIFEAAGLRVVRSEMQKGLPREIFPVCMWALASA